MNTNLENNQAVAQVQAVVTEAVATPTVKKVTKRLPINVTRVYKSDWQKEGSLTAELKQIHETKSYYPSKQVSNNLQDNIFGTDAFGYKDVEFESKKTLVAWLDVPEGSTVESVLEKLSGFPTACIYRVISNHPILHSGQIGQIARLKSEGKLEEAINLKNSIADRQVIIYGEDTTDGLHKAGELILDSHGKPQYKADYFSANERADIDDRNNNVEDYYITPTIKMKMANNQVEVAHPEQSI